MSSFPSFSLSEISETWDEGLPCGNAFLGCLLWGTPDRLKLSLDGTELWDTTPIEEFESENYRFSFIESQVAARDLKPVIDLIERPYETRAGPTKLPGGRMEFSFAGETWKQSGISYKDGTAWQRWESGRQLRTWISATRRVGFIEIEGEGPDSIRLLNPYTGRDYERPDGFDLSMPVSALGYDETETHAGGDWVGYTQRRPDGGAYSVVFQWSQQADRWIGAWTIVLDTPDPLSSARALVELALSEALEIRNEHAAWWSDYWQRSSLSFDDPALTGAWYYHRYLFASAARLSAPPINLQGPWTCDNGFLPPWKGDYHHDLNTQYSYYHALSGNQLDGLIGFIEWLWSLRPACEEWTQRFYECSGLNVPACMDIKGQSLGGWHQYTHSSTTAGWLAHLFYMHWRYSMDRTFLREKAYPWVSACAEFFENHTVFNADGRRCFRLSSSPEIHDNSLAAWFVNTTTQYDLSILRMVFEKASELAAELGHLEDSQKWRDRLAECPDTLTDDSVGLLLAPQTPLAESHRHHAHLMDIHPFESVSWRQGAASQSIIEKSLSHLDQLGTNEWVGYSWGWRAVMWACAGRGDRAIEDVRLFLRAFRSKNGFHLNGDQTGEGHCHWTYRPFTLEGNFLSALALQYMVLQSSGGVVRVFPAMPDEIRESSFENLRAEGAMLVSAWRNAGQTEKVVVLSEHGGYVRLEDPFGGRCFQTQGDHAEFENENGTVRFRLAAGQIITMEVTK